MKTILIPTDFSPETLKCIADLCDGYEPKELNLIFVHVFGLSDSISELLMLSRRSKEYQYISDEFYATCESLKAQLPQINTVHIEFFYGNTVRVFKNFLEQKDVDFILHADFCSCKKLNANSINPAAFAERCGVPTLVVTKKIKHQPVQLPLLTEDAELEARIA